MFNLLKAKKENNEELLQNLTNNPIFIEDYKILDAYNRNIKIDRETLNILSLFDIDEIE